MLNKERQNKQIPMQKFAQGKNSHPLFIFIYIKGIQNLEFQSESLN